MSEHTQLHTTPHYCRPFYTLLHCLIYCTLDYTLPSYLQHSTLPITALHSCGQKTEINVIPHCESPYRLPEPPTIHPGATLPSMFLRLSSDLRLSVSKLPQLSNYLGNYPLVNGHGFRKLPILSPASKHPQVPWEMVVQLRGLQFFPPHNMGLLVPGKWFPL